jgi:hypothetical protein
VFKGEAPFVFKGEAPFVFKGEAPFVIEREPDRSTPWSPTTRRHPRHDCYAYIADPR